MSDEKDKVPCPCGFLTALLSDCVNTDSDQISFSGICSEKKEIVPGIHLLTDEIIIPKNFASVEAKISIAIIDSENKKPVVKLAIKGIDKDGWYPSNSLKTL